MPRVAMSSLSVSWRTRKRRFSPFVLTQFVSIATAATAMR
jgi:hypothetical protein